MSEYTIEQLRFMTNREPADEGDHDYEENHLARALLTALQRATAAERERDDYEKQARQVAESESKSLAAAEVRAEAAEATLRQTERWQTESETMAHDLRVKLAAAEAEVARLTKENDALQRDNAELHDKSADLRTFKRVYEPTMRELKAAARALVEALPRCVGVMVSCDQVTTWTDGNEDYCDGHHASETEGVEDEHLLDNWAELPHAAPLRALRAALGDDDE